MMIQVYTSDKTSPRGFTWLWFIRLVAVIFTLIVLGITAADIKDFHSASCSAPSRLSFNLAVSASSFLALLYFFLATGPKPIFRLLPWIIFGQIALDALMFAFWLAAAATSSYSCKDLCNACAGARDVNYNSQYCVCYTVDDGFQDPFKHSLSPNLRGLLEGRVPRSHHSSTHHSGIYHSSSHGPTNYGSTGSGSGSGINGNTVNYSSQHNELGGVNVAKLCFDAIMTFIFAVYLAASLFWFFKQRRNGGTAAPTSDSVTNTKYEEAGIPTGGAITNDGYQQGAGAEYYSGQPLWQSGEYPEQSMHEAVPQQEAYYKLPAGHAAAREVVSNEKLGEPTSETEPAPQHHAGQPFDSHQ